MTRLFFGLALAVMGFNIGCQAPTTPATLETTSLSSNQANQLFPPSDGPRYVSPQELGYQPNGRLCSAMHDVLYNSYEDVCFEAVNGCQFSYAISQGFRSDAQGYCP